MGLKNTIKKRIPDEAYLKLKYKRIFGHNLNLKNPQTYNEKLQWLKLYDRNPLYTKLVDKYEAKVYVAEKIGGQHVIPTYGVWNHFDDIDFDMLPDSFVLKCTHDSGGVVVCKDKGDLDMVSSREKIETSLKNNYYYQSREWPYKNVPPRIIAEKYMEDTSFGELRDYKFFCFSGEPKVMFVASERMSDQETKFDFFDMNYDHLDVYNGHPTAENIPQKPACFEEMKEFAEILSSGIPHVRIDFYEVDGNIYFGEFTFSHWGGFVPFDPPEWDQKIGEWINLPDRS